MMAAIPSPVARRHQELVEILGFIHSRVHDKTARSSACAKAASSPGANIQAAGYKPNVVEYLRTGWQLDQLLKLFADAGVTPRQALRETKSPAVEMGLLDQDVSDERLLSAMLEEPVLVNRPFVVTVKGTKLCRPSETVLDLLDQHPSGPFYKEDGELMIDGDGRRI